MLWDPSEPYSIERLQIVYKIAERCNLNCSYCYYYHMGDETALSRPARADLNTTAALAKWLLEGCIELSIPKVIIAFHGGEPMLMRSLEFAKTCEILVRELSPHVELSFAIQTNGTLLTDGWFEALKRFKVNIGVSIDGMQSDHDRFRLDHQGQTSFLETEAALRRLVITGTKYPHMQPSTISVLHHEIDYRATYKYLRSLGIQSMHFLLPDRNADEGKDAVRAEAHSIGRGLLQIFEAWLEEDNPDINIRFIDEAMSFFDLKSTQNSLPKPKKSNQILVARSDQTVAVDDSLIPALNWYRKTKEFSITDFSLRDVFRDPIHRFIDTEHNTLPSDCKDCRWSKICGGGDLENRYSESHRFDNPSIYCDTYKTFYHGMCDLLLRIGYPRSEINNRFGEIENV